MDGDLVRSSLYPQARLVGYLGPCPVFPLVPDQGSERILPFPERRSQVHGLISPMGHVTSCRTSRKPFTIHKELIAVIARYAHDKLPGLDGQHELFAEM